MFNVPHEPLARLDPTKNEWLKPSPIAALDTAGATLKARPERNVRNDQVGEHSDYNDEQG
jgi:hypothetical protein